MVRGRGLWGLFESPLLSEIAARTTDYGGGGSKYCSCKALIQEDDKAVECGECKIWHHTKCVDIPLELHRAMSKYDGGKTKSTLTWLYARRNEEGQNLKDWQDKMKAGLAALEKGLTEERKIWDNKVAEVHRKMVEEVDELKKELTELKNGVINDVKK